MRVLVDTQSTSGDTRLWYLHRGLQEVDGIECFQWQDKNQSLFDILDTVRPNIFYTHASSVLSRTNGKLCYDIMYYLSQLRDENFHFVLDSEMWDVESVAEMFKALNESGEMYNKGHVYIVNSNIPKSLIKRKSIKYIKLNHCADSFLKKSFDVNFKIPTAYFVDAETKRIEDSEPHHFISNYDAKSAEISLHEKDLMSLYNNYEQIVFLNKIDSFNQSFFDALYFGNKVFYKKSNESIDKLSKTVFGQVLSYDNKDNIDFNAVRAKINEKHLPANRIKTLLSQLSINQQTFNKVN
tara:strand:+ start:7754 stop:8641 length:888 start_codon:yes stop_codon:yes gene_type:complete